MKLLSSLIVFSLLFLSLGKPADNSIVGSWHLSKQVSGGITTTICATPEIIFYEDGTGTYETSKLPGNFKWKTENNTIKFLLNPEPDKEAFYFDETEYTFEIYTETRREAEVTWLELKHGPTKRSYYLGKETAKP